ncbi:MAG: hypothetical protein HYY84_10640 [Deltaproteobacteria bacterium]|nr:hypothetical protein [Deltaproteobacteria bacterium]
MSASKRLSTSELAARAARVTYLVAPAFVGAMFFVDIGLIVEVPSREAWRRAAGVVRQGWRDGDAVIVAPWWAEEAREALAGMSPRRVEKPAAIDFSPARRLWVVSAFHDAAIGELAARYGKAEVDDRVGGGVRVARFALPDPKVSYDFVSRVREAQVAIQGRAGSQPCRSWAGRAWRCGGGAGNFYFGAQPREFDYTVYNCLWAHPPKDGALVATYGAVTLANRIVVRGGIANFGRRNMAGGRGGVTTPVTLQIAVGNQIIGQAQFTNADSMTPAEFNTAAWRGQTLPVTFAVSAMNNEMRHFCMIPEARE